MRRLIAGAVTAAALVACGGSAGGIGVEAAARLQPWVDKIRSEASAGDIRGARDALARLRADVAALQRDGTLAADDAARVLDAAAQVEQDLGVVTSTTTASSTTTRATSTSTPASTTTSTSTSTTTSKPTTTTTTTPPKDPDKKNGDGDGRRGADGG